MEGVLPPPDTLSHEPLPLVDVEAAKEIDPELLVDASRLAVEREFPCSASSAC